MVISHNINKNKESIEYSRNKKLDFIETEFTVEKTRWYYVN